MAAGGRERRRDLRLPRRPRLGHDRAVRLRSGPDRNGPCARGRVPRRGGRLRPRVLRYLAARGAGDGPAATADPGDLLGGSRTGRHRPRDAARDPYGRVRRNDLPGLRAAAAPGNRGDRRPPPDRKHAQRGLGARRVRARPRGARRHGGHGVLVLAGRPAPGLPVAAAGRMHAGAGRRCDGDGHSGDVPRTRPAARPGPRRTVQVVLGGRRRHRVGRGRRGAAGGASFGRAPPRASRPGDRTRLGRQSGRRKQWPDRAERALAAACDPPGARERAALSGRCGRGRGAWHGDHARRSDRGRGAVGDVRAGSRRGPAAVARLGEVQHRPRSERGRCRGCHQDGDGDAARRSAADAPRRRAVPAHRLGLRCRGTAHRGGGLARHRPSAPSRRVVVRDQRHERPRHPGAGRAGGVRLGRSRQHARSVGAVREDRPSTARPSRPAARLRRGGTGAQPVRRGVHAGHGPGRVGTSGSADRPGRPSTHLRAGKPGRRRAWAGRGHGRRRFPGQGRVRVSWSGVAVDRNGPRPAEELTGVRRNTSPNAKRPWPRTSTGPSPRS